MWQPIPNQPGYYYNPQTGQTAHGSQIGMAAPAAPQQYGQPPQAQPQYGQPQGYGGPAPASNGYGQPPQQQAWGAPPPQQQAWGAPPPQQQAHAPGPNLAPQKPMPQFYEPTTTALPQTSFPRNFQDTPWIQHAKEMAPGQRENIFVRFLPALTEDDRFVTLLEHKLPIEFELQANPQAQRRANDQRRSFYVVCPDFGLNAPGGCAICAVRQSLQGELLTKFKGNYWSRKLVRHYGLNLSNPNVHFVQAKDGNGQPLMGPDGSPQWNCVPGIVVMGSELYTAVTNRSANAAGAIDSRDRGIVMQLSKMKTGTGQMDVSYDADRGQEFPLLGTPWAAVLPNIDSLRARFQRYRSTEEMVKFADLIKQQMGVGQTSYSLPSGQPSAQPQYPGFGGPAAPGYGQPAGAPAWGPAPASPMGPGMPPGLQPQGGFAPAVPAMQQAPQGAQSPYGAAPAPQQHGPAPSPYQPSVPQGLPPSAMPPVPQYQGHLPPISVPQQQHTHGPAHPQGGPNMSPVQFAPPPGPQYPGGAPHVQQPQGQGPAPQYLPPQQQQPQQGAPFMSPEEAERAVKPSGGSIPF